MQTQQHSQQFLRKRKALLVMPLIVIPFIVFFAWVLGIVDPAEANGQANNITQGINTNLPAAVPSKDSTWDKLSFYEQADRDSAKMKQLQRQDPYFNKNKKSNELLRKYSSKLTYQPYPDSALNETDMQEKKVYERINAIHKEIGRTPKKKLAKKETITADAISSKEVDRLERMMEMVNDKPQEDEEMKQLASFIESIKDIQHPELVKERLKKEEIRPKVFTVGLFENRQPSNSIETNRFYSLESTALEDVDPHQMINAVIHETQTVANNELIKLRLTQSVFIDGTEIPENHFVYGQVKINTNRLLIHIPVVQMYGIHLPVSLKVYGHDGLEGIPVNNSTSAEALNNAGDKSVQSINLNSLDPSLGAEVAAAVMQSGKSLFKKQTRIARYSVPAGYTVNMQNAD